MEPFLLLFLIFPALGFGFIIWQIVSHIRWQRAFKQKHLGWCDGQRLYCSFPEYHTTACPKGCGCPKHVNERAW